MWKFKPFTQKEPAGLEGRFLEIGNLKVQVRNVIAEGGFSSVYLAQDVNHASKQYALKHIICNDEESLELVMKEISVLKSLKGHPNVVTLYAHGILDMGRNKKEALLAMDFCGKSLVDVLENRGAGYFEEKQALTIFRDVCNAVFAMHCQTPRIAHRDLKAENLLLSSDGQWKLCDFGSVSKNHKIFERAEEMGIEEDNIRKYTTPTYRAPEMWDLFRREMISEKVDIWALGCLLFRICYFKNAFDGESKLQILNGNYRIPESPKYSAFVTDLIKEMLQASPDERPDITQIWFRVNEQLPANLQKSLPDRPPEMQSTGVHDGSSKSANKSSPVPRRSPPPPPPSSGESDSGGPLGAFWATQHAKTSVLSEDNKSMPKFDEPNSNTTKSERVRVDSQHPKKPSPVRGEVRGMNSQKDTTPAATNNRTRVSKDDAFNSFVADFDTTKLDNGNKPGKEEALEAEIERLKDELKKTNSEKAEITAKFEKLSAICRSQRQELQDLKQSLASKSASPSPSRDSSQSQPSPGMHSMSSTPSRDKIEGTMWELQQDRSNWSTGSSDTNSWQPFSDEAKPVMESASKGTQGFEAWGFETESFRAAATSSATTASATQRSMGSGNNTSQRYGNSKMRDNQKTAQPAGWAGF
ncbi:probable serine/threonine-protein kinase DDB_G0276461 isoform X2 [Arabidopsis lyrata subsp. lyrata]|uniref:probable serine/threonine-protein kinase DDB_G0276461 isoform X2 n=1 Tax=Arabidopsis lyrata subsp. lyrata TaxID=81972 RepID=UPI000A29D704|nr:probable serine/threonine-protein kinase DDB_G0276461 isoform X2 [Arabidopsis lyrata subsp. lyrata]|eukprot:XP_020884314.1 probable serine/threonine-protein kinase DDB_G0276461 isoform X2 [Arabidopsis lyrata subsp. lyrata]